MHHGRCNTCGVVTDVIRGLGSCPDCATDAHRKSLDATRMAAIAKRNTRYLANKKRRAGGSR